MSVRHRKRSRCVICGEVTWHHPTFAYLLVEFSRYAYLQPGQAQLCAVCREAWWKPMQLPLWSEPDLADNELPSQAPEWTAQPGPSASWPPSSSRAWVNRKLSVLVGSDPA